MSVKQFGSRSRPLSRLFATGFTQALENLENHQKKSSMHGKIMEFEKKMNNHEKIMGFYEIICQNHQ